MVRSVDETLRQAQQHQAAGRWLAAAAVYAQLALSHPRDHRLLANQGNALWLADLPAAAAQAYGRALVLRPDCPVSRRGLASCLRDLNDCAAAAALHSQLAAELAPASAEGLANLWAHSQVLIGLQRFGEAFDLLARRRPHRDPLAPALTLESEQGFGDTLQFVRFVGPLMHRRRAAGLQGGVRLLVEPALVGLLQQGLAWLEPAPIVEVKPAQSRPAARPSLLTLPGMLGLQRLSTTAPEGAYLLSPAWQQPQPQPLQPPPLGLVWRAGAPGNDPFCVREFHKRTLPEAILWRLVSELQACGAQIHNLQFGPEALGHQALGLELVDHGRALAGFAGTAQVVAQLDLVISVDTAMAHLAGALGKPCWVLLPWSADPRWLAAGPLTPWYGRSRLFRQPRPGDWHGAVDQLLECFAAARLASTTVFRVESERATGWLC